MPRRKKLAPAVKAPKVRAPRSKVFRPVPNAAWFQERIAFVFGEDSSVRQVSKTTLGHEDYLYRVLSGDDNARLLRPDEIIVLAQALKVTVTTILHHLGYAIGPTTVPLVGRVNEFARVQMLPP